ncbi:hypothetical protein [Peribacillus sp. NPDC096540]|uniref:hypothetical protein n=1 Tax=Peribacillus sp. NPDC096540 TaxID=3390612 RepID=UPI003D093509
MLTSQEWEKINGFTLQISRMNINKNMKRELLISLKQFIDFDRGFFNLSVIEKDEFITYEECVQVSYFRQELGRSFDKHFKSYQKMDYLYWTVYNKESLIARDTDLINREILIKLPFYTEFLKPYELTNIVNIVINHKVYA